MRPFPATLGDLLEQPFLTGKDWDRFCRRCRDRSSEFESGEAILCAEADVVEALAVIFAGVLKSCAVFLANPQWSAAEWKQVTQLTGFNRVIGPTDIMPDPARAPTCTYARIMIPSGGTSGKIRFCVHSLDTLSAAVERLFRLHGGKPLNSINLLPAFHVSGLMPVIRACLTGGQVHLTHWKSLESGQFPGLPGYPTSLSLVPTQMARLIRTDAGLRFLHGLDIIYVGGAATPPALVSFIRIEKLPVLFVYGSTETTAMVLSGTRADTDGEGAVWGHPLPGVSVNLTPDQEIVIKTPSLFRGYYPDDSARSEYHTGDLGRWVADGAVQVIGRKDFLINTGGEKVNPEEVEAAIMELLPEARVAVCGLPDEEWGERVVAVFEHEIMEDKVTTLKTILGERLAAYKVPKDFLSGQVIPRLAVGKVNRAELRRQLVD